MEKQVVCCDEHVELALDVIVDETGEFPNLEAYTENKGLSTTCEYCEKPSVYLVSN